LHHEDRTGNISQERGSRKERTETITFCASIVDAECEEGAEIIGCRLENRYRKQKGTEQTQNVKTTVYPLQQQVLARTEVAYPVGPTDSARPFVKEPAGTP
jgi:hypothetical protein